jgi:hypothetical protein
MEEGEETTRGRLLWARYTPSLGARSNLGKLVVAVFGRELTKDEMEAFDPESLIGHQVDAMVEQQPSKDGTQVFNNILSVSKNLKALKGIEKTAEKPAVIKQKTTPAVAPAPAEAEDPENFIAQAEKEAQNAKAKAKAKAAPVVEDTAAAEEAELAQAEADAAELASKAAQAKLEAARKKAALRATA